MRLGVQATYSIMIVQALKGKNGFIGVTGIMKLLPIRVPQPMVEKMCSRMAAAGLLFSAKGPGGGYTLEHTTITLGELLEALGYHPTQYKTHKALNGIIEKIDFVLEGIIL